MLWLGVFWWLALARPGAVEGGQELDNRARPGGAEPRDRLYVNMNELKAGGLVFWKVC